MAKYLPIEGKLYPAQFLVNLLGLTKGTISITAKRHNWANPAPGLYYAQDVEPWLEQRGVVLSEIPVKNYSHLDGVTDSELDKEHEGSWQTDELPGF